MERLGIKNLKIVVSSIILGGSLVLAGCGLFGNKKEEAASVIVETVDESLETDVSVETTAIDAETNDVLATYNQFLQQRNSDKVLTEEDIRIIEENTHDGCLISVKLGDDQYTQVGPEYIMAETENQELVLLAPISIANLDMFTSNEVDRRDLNKLGTLGDYIAENNIDTVGYTLQKYRSWSDHGVSYVRENYGEDVLNCLQENGFPLPVYDVQDFYDAYAQSISSNRLNPVMHKRYK